MKMDELRPGDYYQAIEDGDEIDLIIAITTRAMGRFDG